MLKHLFVYYSHTFHVCCSDPLTKKGGDNSILYKCGLKLVVDSGEHYILDVNTAARIKKESPKPSAFKASEFALEKDDESSPNTPRYSEYKLQTRATCYVLLSVLCSGRSGVRLQV